MGIGQETIGHWDQLWAEVEQAIGRIPDELWTRDLCGSGGWWSRPCYVAHHMVWCMALDHLLRVPFDAMPHNVFPDYGKGIEISQQQVLDILSDIRHQCRARYRDMTDEDYLTPDDKGMVPISRVMYALAHTRQHYGQLVQILRENGIDAPDWYPLGGE
jgi:hypothetical protein